MSPARAPRRASCTASVPAPGRGGRGAAALLLAILALPGGCGAAGVPTPAAAGPGEGSADGLEDLAGFGVVPAEPVQRRARDAEAERVRERSAVLAEVSSPLVAELALSWPAEPAARGAERFARSTETVWGQGADGSEWWFERNPLRRQQLAGAQVPAGAEVVLDYGWAELLDGGLTTGWNALATLGIDAAERAALQPGGAERLAFGLRFRELRGEPEGDGLLELWWNDEHQVPLRSVRRAGGELVVRELTALRLQADAALLAHPSARHPEAARQDLCDWHDDPKHAGAHVHAAPAPGGTR